MACYVGVYAGSGVDGVDCVAWVVRLRVVGVDGCYDVVTYDGTDVAVYLCWL